MKGPPLLSQAEAARVGEALMQELAKVQNNFRGSLKHARHGTAGHARALAIRVLRQAQVSRSTKKDMGWVANRSRVFRPDRPLGCGNRPGPRIRMREDEVREGLDAVVSDTQAINIKHCVCCGIASFLIFELLRESDSL